MTVSPLRPAIVLCTRNRPADLARSLARLLLVRPPGCPLVVVDQSTDDESARLVAAADETVIYLPSTRTGLCLARNEGVAAAHGDLVLFTDDDCEPEPGWVEGWLAVFEGHPEYGIGFGRVRAPAYDTGLGHIPVFDPGATTRSWDVGIFRHGAGHVGMGANMVARRDVLLAVGGFDELLGAGAPFVAADDIDLALRVLDDGHRLVHSGGPGVVHHGFRPTADATALGKGYSLGTGAMYTKHLRCRRPRAGRLLARALGQHVGRVVRTTVTGRRPTGLHSLLSFVQGLAVARSQPVDRGRGVYRPAGPA